MPIAGCSCESCIAERKKLQATKLDAPYLTGNAGWYKPLVPADWWDIKRERATETKTMKINVRQEKPTAEFELSMVQNGRGDVTVLSSREGQFAYSLITFCADGKIFKHGGCGGCGWPLEGGTTSVEIKER